MILIFPYAKPLFDATGENPKNYPYWPEVIKLLTDAGHTVIQAGLTGEKELVDDFRKDLPISELSTLVQECDTWISVDSFAQHLCWDLNKPGVVIFSQSDPNIFGHKENTNLLKDRKYLREKQFWLWSQTEYKIEAYVTPETVFNAVLTYLQ
jgi:ADP-heptose:LPS heptosyltransferase